ncbi:MAG: LptF/LptG family permease [Candidatus Sericytochromatia bacterium]
MFRITDRYILSELLKPFVAGVVAFMIIMISNTLYIFMELIVKSNIDTVTVLKMLLYNLPAIIVVTLPVAYMFATLLALGRLGRDSEIIALRACGVSFSRVIAPVIVVSLLVSALGFYLQENVVPWANQQTVEILKEMMSKEPLQAVKEKYFLKTDQRNFYVNEINRAQGILRNVFVFDQTKAEFPQIIGAQAATREQTRWVLRDGILHKLEGSGYLDHEIRFKRMEIQMELKPDMVFNTQLDVRQMASGPAKDLIDQKRAQGQDTRQDEMDYYTKFSLPLATFFTILLAAPIGILFSKMGNYFGVAISIALVFVWYVTYSIFTSLGKAGTVPPLLAAWVQNLAFGGIGLLMLMQLSGIHIFRYLLWPFKILFWPLIALVRKMAPRRPRTAKPPAA